MSYRAFISYSHSSDSTLSASIENALERFAKPTFKRRALRIFRDENDLSASPDLWGTIEKGIDQSEYFIFMASPESAESYWCKKEINHWLKNNGVNNLLLVITKGEMIWNEAIGDFDWSKTDALPTLLKESFLSVPHYVDLRDYSIKDQQNLKNAEFNQRIAQLASTLHGKSIGDMHGEAVKQHKRTIRIRNSAISVLCFLLIISITISIYALRQRNEAQRQKDIAIQNAKNAVSRQIASEANKHESIRRDISLLLAKEAYQIDKNIDTRASLFETIQNNKHLKSLLHGLPIGNDCMCLHPDKSILLLGKEQYLEAINTQTKETIFRVNTQNNTTPIKCSIASTGEIFATLYDNFIIGRDYKTLNECFKIPCDSFSVHNITLFDKGRMLMVETDTANLVYNLGSDYSIKGVPQKINDSNYLNLNETIEVIKDSSIVVYNLNNSAIIIHDISTNEKLELKIPTPTADTDSIEIDGIDITNDASQIAIVYTNGSVKLINTNDGKTIHEIANVCTECGSPGIYGRDVKINKSNNRIGIKHTDSNLEIYNLNRPNSLPIKLRAHLNFVSQLEFGHHDDQLYTLGREGVVAIWDLSNTNEVYDTLNIESLVKLKPSWTQIGINRRGELIALGWDQRKSFLVNVTKNQKQYIPDSINNSEIGYTRISKDGEHIFISTNDSLYYSKVDNHFQWYSISSYNAATVSVSPNGKHIATSSEEGLVEIWQIDNIRNPPKTLNLSSEAIKIAFNFDASILATASIDNGISFWDLSKMKLIGKQREFTGPFPTEMIFHPSLNILATRSTPKAKSAVQFYYVYEDRIHTMIGHEGPVNGICFSPDGSKLISAGYDPRFIIWDVYSPSANGVYLNELDDHIDEMAISLDGKYIYALEFDGTIARILIDENSWLDIASYKAGRSLTSYEKELHYGNYTDILNFINSN